MRSSRSLSRCSEGELPLPGTDRQQIHAKGLPPAARIAHSSQNSVKWYRHPWRDSDTRRSALPRKCKGLRRRNRGLSRFKIGPAIPTLRPLRTAGAVFCVWWNLDALASLRPIRHWSVDFALAGAVFSFHTLPASHVLFMLTLQLFVLKASSLK